MTGIMTSIRRLVLALIAVALAAFAAVVVLFRTKPPTVLRPFTRWQRDRANPQILKTAGEPGVKNGVIYHVGRTSGRQFETPVTPIATEGGFLIALPYGRETQWLKNVLAAGRAALRFDGEMIRLANPRIVRSTEVQQYFGAKEKVLQQIFALNECLLLDRVER